MVWQKSPSSPWVGRKEAHNDSRASWLLEEVLGTLRLNPRDIKYPPPEEVAFRVQSLKKEHKNELRLHLIGRSRQGLPLFALQIEGGETVALAVANVYADEMAGTASLLLLAQNLLKNPSFHPLRQRFTFLLLPQVNPDGGSRNLGWMRTDFDLFACLTQRFRDLPEEEIDHGFPEVAKEKVRPEVQAILGFLKRWPRIALFVHLRGALFGGGVQFLLEPLREEVWRSTLRVLTETCRRLQIPLNDFNLLGQRGYQRWRRGFQSLPSTEALRSFFRLGDSEYAEALRLSFFDYLRRQHGTERALVVEIPFLMMEGLHDMTPVGGERVPLEEERARAFLEAAENLEGMVERLESLAGSSQEGLLGLDYAHRLARFHRMYGRALQADKGRFEGFQATRRDVLEVQIQRELLRFLPGATALQLLRALNQRSLQGEYLEGLKRLYHSFQRRFRWNPLPLQHHLRLHLATALAATLAAFEEGEGGQNGDSAL